MITVSHPTINTFNDAYQMSNQSYSTACDVTEMNTYMAQDTSQYQWSKRVLHEITGLLYVLSPLGRILYCSESSLRLIGYQPSELVGRSLTEFLHVEDLSLFTSNFQHAFSSATRVKVHYRIRCKNNTYLLFETIGQPKKDVSGHSFLAISQPYISRSNGLLDSFLEMKAENEMLKKQLNDILQKKNAASNDDYFSPMTSSSHFTSSPYATTPADVFPIQPPQQDPAFYPVATPSPIHYADKRAFSNESHSELFYFNTPRDDLNTKFALGYFPQYTPSVTSSTECKDMLPKVPNDDLYQDPFLFAPNYLSSSNIRPKDTWKRRRKNKSTDDYICTDCGTTASPEWRKGPNGPKTLCNACGLRWAKKNKQN